MARKPARFGELAQTPAPAVQDAPEAQPAETEEQQTLPVPLPQRRVNRRAKKLVGGHFDTQAAKSLSMLALEHDMTLQSLMAEAFNDILRKYGKHPTF